MASRTKTVDRAMPDVQSSPDQRNIKIDKVGVRGITYPISLQCPATSGVQHTVAQVNMYVGLPHDQKGTHMSRFMEVLNKHHDFIRSDQVMLIVREIRDRLEAEEAHLELRFPYFIHKKAPITKAPGMLDVQVTFECTAGPVDDFIMGVKVPATSLCPCSKEISDYGAHNQRSVVTLRVELLQDIAWAELVRFAEDEASSELWPLLKRPDEKWVTERAYENPKFVEDLVRDVALRLERDARIGHYRVDVENFESIHNHSAFATIVR